MSQLELATKLNVTRQYISKLKTGNWTYVNKINKF
ncbi:helix-turn-helix domain-containing protein [Garciella nitratireducens]